MKYREFGELKTKVSALGFGCMRLPTLDGLPQSGNIDEAETIRMIRRAVDGYGGWSAECLPEVDAVLGKNQSPTKRNHALTTRPSSGWP